MGIVLVRAASFWMGAVRRSRGSCEMPLESHRGEVTAAGFPKPELCFSWTSPAPGHHAGRTRNPTMRLSSLIFIFLFSLWEESLGQGYATIRGCSKHPESSPPGGLLLPPGQGLLGMSPGTVAHRWLLVARRDNTAGLLIAESSLIAHSTTRY